MKRKTLKLNLKVLKTINSDINYLECSFCDRTFHKAGVTYYELETENILATICSSCLKEIEVENSFNDVKQ